MNDIEQAEQRGAEKVRRQLIEIISQATIEKPQPVEAWLARMDILKKMGLIAIQEKSSDHQ